MSLETWRAEFYPIPASEEVKDEKTATEQSLLKWKGLRLEALKFHGIEKKVREKLFDLENDYFLVDSSSCALCALNKNLRDCGSCILLIIRGTPCDQTLNDDDESPFFYFINEHSPEPMIELLEKALEILIERETRND